MIHIFTTSINLDRDMVSDTIFAISYVSKERQAQISRIKYESGKMLSLYAALLTRKALCELLNLPNEALQFSKTPEGKPYCTNSTNIHFNYSHTNGRILLAVSDREVGADVELIKNYPTKVANKVCHEAELKYINESGTSCESRFFKVWTRKEAYAKFMGTGLTFNLREFNTLADDESDNFMTWADSEYVYSIYANKIGDTLIQNVSPEDITTFFSSKKS